MRIDEKIRDGLSVFATVVRRGSFAAAAKALGISQPAVSRIVARLEARLDVRLLERTTRSVVLSDDGRRLFEEVIPLLSELEEATSAILEGRSTVRGRLRVNVHPFFSQLILGARLRKFLDQHPELNVELISREQLGDLVGEGFDLAIRFGDPRNSSLIARRLLETRILTVAAPSYLKRQGKPQSPSDLETGKHTLIDFRDPETGRPFQWEFRRGRKALQVQTPSRLVVNDVITMHNICLTGYGIAQMMELGIEKMLESGQLVPLFPDWSEEMFPLFALYPSRKHLPAKTRAFVDFVLSIGKPN